MIEFRKKHGAVRKNSFFTGEVNKRDLNMHWEALDMDVPVIAGCHWARTVDTSLPSPSDIADPGMEVACPAQSYRVNARSIVVLVNKPG